MSTIEKAKNNRCSYEDIKHLNSKTKSDKQFCDLKVLIRKLKPFQSNESDLVPQAVVKCERLF